MKIHDPQKPHPSQKIIHNPTIDYEVQEFMKVNLIDPRMGQTGNTAAFVIFLSLSIGSVVVSFISVMSIFKGGLGIIGIHITVFILTGTFIILTWYFFKKNYKLRQLGQEK